MDPIDKIKVHKDTTLALLLAATAAGYELYYMEMHHLFIHQGRASGLIHPLKVYDDEEQWYTLGEAQHSSLADLDVILMRKDPPFDSVFLHSTYLLEMAEKEGCLVVNKPQSLRDCNEKLFATQFPQCCPPLCVSNNSDVLKAFHAEHGDVIFKPLDGMGGTGIFRCQPDGTNLGVILETLTRGGIEYIMAQRFIPEITEGDKRILVVNGEAIPYSLARVPAKGETRGNLAAGGSGRPQPLSERDRWIVSQVAPTLLEKDLLFVGLDVIGDYLTEINVTSPTCVREIDRAYDVGIADKLMAAIQQRLDKR